ncbi:uncharacterized protein LOC134441060 [Engraulis encrasicolus]|uniref:uncharacterized protein LOC134441060 n=1 Tax=Engraulis encrasicolus TaxID=184585 RepID=UPI002FD784E9
MYSIVIFSETEETEIVPSEWLSIDKSVTYWPRYKASICSVAVIKREEPNEAWKKSSRVAVETHQSSLPAIPPLTPDISQKKSSRVAVEIHSLPDTPHLTPVPPETPQKKSSRVAVEIHSLPDTPHLTPVPPETPQLYKLLAEISGQVRQNTLLLQALHKKRDSCEVGDADYDFPLRTLTCVKTMEARLVEQEAKRCLTRYLCSLGGATSKDVLHRILRHVMTDELANKFNWRGRGAKSPFSALILAKVIIANRDFQ